MKNFKMLIAILVCSYCSNVNVFANSDFFLDEKIENANSKGPSSALGSITVSNYAGGSYSFGEGNTWLGANGGAGAPDGTGAVSLVFANNTSAFLLAKEFGFDIPCNAIIESVSFRVTRRNAANIATTVNAIDSTISVFNPLTLSVGSFNAADPSVWVQDGVSYETVTYTDVNWGVNMTPELINNERFGLVIEAKHGSLAGRIEATIDAVEMEVCYALTDPPVTAIDFTVDKTVACYDEGVITINPTGGTGNYEYTINTGASWQSSNTFTNLPIGTYLVGVRNSNMTCQTAFRFTSLSGDERIIQPGDAVVSCATYPGNRVTLAIEKMQPAYDLYSQGEVGYDISPFLEGHPFEWTVEDLGGEVFSMAVDQDRNIYTVTTSLYDITPGANVPSIVSKIDAVTGGVTQIASLPSSVGSAGIEYDSLCNVLYVTNLDNGIIYLMDPETGAINDTFDPMGADDGSAGFAPLGERVMAVTKNHSDGKLYYSLWNSDYNQTGIRNTVRSIDIDPISCSFIDATDTEVFQTPWTSEYGDVTNTLDFSMPVTDIDFSVDGQTLILAEAGFDSNGPVSRPHNARALRYLLQGGTWVLQTTIPAGNTALELELGEFSEGVNARGGIAFANSGYDGDLCAIDNDAFIMATSDAMRGADCNSIGCFYGIQYLPTTGGNATTSVLLDIGRDPGTQQKGIFGDIDVLKGCLAGIYCCPDLTTNEPNINVCPGTPVSDLVFDTQADSLVLVYHTTIPLDVNEVYNNGIPIDTMQVLAGQTSLSVDSLPLDMPGVYYVYGLVYPTPLLDYCRPYDSLIVNVRTLPTVGLNDPADECVTGTDMTFTGSPAPGGGTIGQFTSNAAFGFAETGSGSGVAILDLDVAGPGDYTITYTYTDLFGCTDSTSTDVTIFDIPTVTISDPADVCVDGADLNFTGSPLPASGTTGVFTSTVLNGLSDNGDGTATIDVDVATPGTYDVTYTYTDLQGCQNSSTVEVIINALPVASINDPADECLVGSAFSFSSTPIPSGGDMGVYTTTALAGLSDNGDGTATIDPMLAGPGVYDVTYTYTDLNGCIDAATTSVEVFDTLANVIVGIGNICGDPTFGTNTIDLNSLIISGPGGGTWNDDDATGSLSGSVFTADITDQGNTYDFTYTITGPGPIGTDCQTRSFTTSVNVVYCNLDVALIKTTSQVNPVALNDIVTFEYTICNQGFTNVDSLEITDYLPSCYGFFDNNGWTSSGLNAVTTLTVTNGGLPVGGLPTPVSAPDNCVTVAMDLTILCGTPSDLINYAEITGHRDVNGNTDDFDSTPGSDSTLERNVLPGDIDDDSFTDLNEDDHDPSVVPVVDIALVSTPSITGTLSYGQEVSMDIQVINQGNVDLNDIEITNYIPCGMAFSPSNGLAWSEVGSNAVQTIANLGAGETTTISLLLNVLEKASGCVADSAWLNETEVSQMFSGLQDVSLLDFDSRANNIQGDDAGGAPNTSADNSVIGNGTGLVGDTDAATDEDDHDPVLLDIYDLSLDKSVTSTGPYGQDSIVTYQIQVYNEGNVLANGIEVADIPQLGLNFVSSDAGSNPNVIETGTGLWQIGTLPPDAFEVINATFIVTNNFQGLTLFNDVAITADDGDDIDSDPDLDNTQDEDGDLDPYDDDEDSESIDLDQFYDLAFTKTEVSTGPYQQGDFITYELAVLNEGTLNAANVQFVDMPDAGLEFVSDNSASNANVNAIAPLTYEIAALDFGDSESIQVTFSVNRTYQDTLIMNSGQIIFDDGDDRDSDPNFGPNDDEDGDLDGDDDDEDFVVSDILQVYDLSLAKNVTSSGPYNPGDQISYSISITNEGSLNASNIEFEELPELGLTLISDDSNSNANISFIAPGIYRVASLLQGATETLNLVYEIDPDFQALTIGNEAQITFDDGDDDDSDPDVGPDTDDNGDGDLDDDDEDDQIVDVVQVYDLSVEKVLLTNTQIFPGDDVTFLITINNEGTLDANNIELTEIPATEMIFVSSTAGLNPNINVINNNLYSINSLLHGTSESFEITYNIPIDYLVPTIENLVEITQDDGDDDDSDPSTSIDIDEDGDGDGYDDDESLATVPVIIGYNLGDYVWHDLDGDGIQDFNESGIEGIFVTLYNSLGFVIDVAVTDANGYYLFEEVFPGNYFIGVGSTDDYMSTYADVGFDDSRDSDLTDENGLGTTSIFTLDDDDITQDLGLVQCASIGETVWFDYNENDIEDLTENGINGMKVQLYRFEPLGWTLHDEYITGLKPGTGSDDGYYKFCVQPGRYYLKFVNPPESLVPARPNRGSDLVDSDVTNRFGQGTTDDFTLFSGEEKCDIGAGYYAMGTIGDYVWQDSNQNGMRESNESGLSGVVMRAINSEGTVVASTISDENGNYMLDYLGKEEYYIEVVPPLGMVASLSNVGNDESLDSDLDGSNGPNTTGMYQVTPGEHIGNVDIGLVFGVLPVEWLDVWGENRGQYNYIEWSVASEINVSHYMIERTRNLSISDWDEVGQVDFREGLNNVNVYNFEDYKLEDNDLFFYRIKQVDLNGKYNYSKTIAIYNDEYEVINAEVKTYPNPAIDNLNLELMLPNNFEKVKAVLFNQNGKLILNNVLEAKENKVGLNQHLIDISRLDNGVYMLSIEVDEKQFYEKIVIMK